ncbi:MAG: PIN domain-containing protein [Anaerolineae bacterium]|nr:PIN domain-containing protein [Anaerolineae bacterium]MDW8067587.1 PIN domain-containing protein [Anaerolineae bacterium]
MVALTDTSFLFALADSSDRHHPRALAVARSFREPLVLPCPVLPEICYLLDSRLGHKAMQQFVRELIRNTVPLEPLQPHDLPRVLELLEHYEDMGLDFTDAAIVAIAERLKATMILTLDYRHFTVIRPSHCDRFRILPSPQ